MALGVAGPLGDLLGLDHLDDRRAGGIRLGIDDVDARRPEPRHYQVPPLDMRVRGIGAEHRAAGVPAEMVELVPRMGHLHLADDPAVAAGTRVHVDDTDRITPAVRGRVGPNDVRQLFRRGLGRQPRRRIKTRVGSPHGFLLLPELSINRETGVGCGGALSPPGTDTVAGALSWVVDLQHTPHTPLTYSPGSAVSCIEKMGGVRPSKRNLQSQATGGESIMG